MNYRISLLNAIGFIITLYGLIGFFAWAYGRIFYNDTESDVTMKLIPYFIGIGVVVLLFDYLLQKILKLKSTVINIIGLITIVGLFYLSKAVFS